MEPLLVAEVFSSIQGESHWAGYPCTFIRLAGCNLACRYCDTRYAADSTDGVRRTESELLREAGDRGLPLVQVTGGEPLLQSGTPSLLRSLVHQGYRTLLETNGSVALDDVPPGTVVVMDLKTPGSGMATHNRWDNLSCLRSGDEVKMVCCDRGDYEWARAVLMEDRLPSGIRVSLSPVWNQLDAAELARWVLEDRLPVRVQVQLHRVLWPDRERGV